MSTLATRLLPALLLVIVVAAPAAEGAASPQVKYASCATAFRGFGNFAWEEKKELFLKSESASANPFLSVDAAAGGATSFTASDVQSGPMGIASAPTGGLGTPVKFPLKSNLDKFWLNLSKPIVGSVFVSGTVPTSGAGRDYVTFRIELMQGELRVGGAQCMTTPNSARGAFTKLMFWFRPEVPFLDPALPLELHITRIGGLSDFVIGTGGSQASVIELRGWSRDPLQGTIGLERYKLVGLPPPPEGQAALAAEPETGAVPAYAGLLPLLGLFALTTRRSSRRVLVAILLVSAAAAAGCLGSAPTPKTGGGDGADPTQTPEVEEKRTENETLKKQGIGALQGRVHDDTNLSVVGASVIVVGSSLFGKTDGRGEFSFPNITEGSYVLRIDAPKFLTLERPVEVKVGTTLTLDIQLVRVGNGAGGTKPHTHPSFPESGVLDLWVKDFYLLGQNPWVCTYDDPCETQIPIDPSLFAIPSGTGIVQVKLSFTGVEGHRRMGLRIETPANTSADQYFLPRESGKPFNIAIFPNEADPGHQVFTNWVFYAYLENRESPANALLGPPVSRGGVIHAEFKAFRGVYPLEPPHRDLWANQTELPLFDNAPITPSAAATTGPLDYPGSNAKWSIAKDGFIPPGSLEIRGVMSWNSDAAVYPFPTDWTLAFKTAASPAGAPILKAPTSVTRGTNKIDFVIKVDEKDADKFYQTSSAWTFYIDDGKEPFATHPTSGAKFSQNNGAGTTFKLSATVYKDPAYEFGGEA